MEHNSIDMVNAVQLFSALNLIILAADRSSLLLYLLHNKLTNKRYSTVNGLTGCHFPHVAHITNLRFRRESNGHFSSVLVNDSSCFPSSTMLEGLGVLGS